MGVLDIDVEAQLGAFHLQVASRVAEHGTTALFGPSGSGKSTLLRIVAGLEPRARGRVTFSGETWLDTATDRFVPPHRRGIGFVFQDAKLFPHLSVRGNLRYADRRSAGVQSSIDFAGIVRAFDLQALLDRRPDSLSGGERQRVATARALLTRPRLMLMDEPLAALDARRKAEVLPYIEQLPGKFGVAVVYVTHALDEVAQLAQRMLVIADGRPAAEGPLTDILERLDLQPATGRFEAGVVLTARVARQDQAFQLTELDHHGQSISMPLVPAAIGDEVRLRIRARDVSLARERPSGISIRNILRGTIVQIEEEAGTAFAETLIDIGGARLRARITRAAVAELKLRPGLPVHALVKSVALDRRALGAGGALPM